MKSRSDVPCHNNRDRALSYWDRRNRFERIWSRSNEITAIIVIHYFICRIANPLYRHSSDIHMTLFSCHLSFFLPFAGSHWLFRIMKALDKLTVLAWGSTGSRHTRATLYLVITRDLPVRLGAAHLIEKNPFIPFVSRMRNSPRVIYPQHSG